MRLDISAFELHNLEKDGANLRGRRALASLKTPSVNTLFVGGFTLESPNTTEPWHYLFEQSTLTGVATLRVFNEEFFEIFNYPLGVLQKNPAITYASQNMQVMINSPALSVPLYGLVGGGVIAAVKTASALEDTTALDIPGGHICVFGDRFAIAQGNDLFFNDPGIDPRTFVDENVVALPGTIYDIFQGQDGTLYIFTSAGAYTLPQDALGQGQEVVGALGKIPGLETTRPRNAIAVGAGAAVLQRDGVVLVGVGPPVKIDLSPYDGRRYYSHVTEADDLRLAAELFATPGGFVVGFRGHRGQFIVFNLAAQSFSYVWGEGSDFNVVGTLRSRDGEALVILEDRVVVAAITGPEDFDGGEVISVAAGRIAFEEADQPVVETVTIAAANQANDVAAYVSGAAREATTPVKNGELTIGTSKWSAIVGNYTGRETRTVRLTPAKRTSDPNMEIVMNGGGGRRLNAGVTVDLGGQERTRRDRN